MAKLPEGTINMEQSVNEDQIIDALNDVMNQMRAYNKKHKTIRKKPIIVRPVGGDREGYLSPTFRRYPTYFIDIPYDKKDTKETELFKNLENLFLKKQKARVSFARLFWQIDHVIDSFEYKYQWYNAKMKMDPNNVFTNTFSEQIVKKLDKNIARETQY